MPHPEKRCHFLEVPDRKSRRDGERHEILFGTIDKRRDL